MEILAIIGILVLILFVFIGGGILGWIFNGIGSIFCANETVGAWSQPA